MTLYSGAGFIGLVRACILCQTSVACHLPAVSGHEIPDCELGQAKKGE